MNKLMMAIELSLCLGNINLVLAQTSFGNINLVLVASLDDVHHALADISCCLLLLLLLLSAYR
jgi:hypothetical protein